MNLTAAIRTAQSALLNTSAQTAVVSRNVAGASDAGYSRKIASSTYDQLGGQGVTVRRAQDAALLENMLEATSRAASSQAVSDGVDRLDATVGDAENGFSPAARLGALNDALQLYSAQPSDVSLAQSVISAANDLTTALNDATATVRDVRRQADADIAQGVDDLNSLLADFDRANSAVVNGTHAGADISDELDTRDELLSKISELVGVRTITRSGNDVAIYTDSGVTMFDGAAREVSFTASSALSAGATGSAIVIDGVPVTGDSATMPIRSGKLQGLATLRDDVTVTYQSQLDEIARGMIEVFAESDQGTPATLPDQPGLFTYSGAPAMPGGSWVPGLAGEIAVNANVDPAQGGSLSLLRDGGISDPGNAAYTYNGTGAESYSDRLNALLGGLQSDITFDSAAGIDASASLLTFATSSVSWLGATRSSASGDAEYQTTLLSRASDALSNATGVNLDDEMSLLLELERSYQASSKLLATIDDMFASLFASV